ncbi:MAG: tripartite tricarboxylate transporter substrate binding protein [Betaproteobacteria bacterium]|nr:tripartite tricarboxylate transporter substrate binding protein [Betaproteobacteria bacterium]
MLAHSMLKIVSAGLALLAAAAATHAAGIAYPTKPIRLIVPFPPGGSADPLARAFGAWFSDKFGVPVIADNRPGAGTAIAHTLAAKAAPDGYTLVLGAGSGLSTNPAFGTKLEYDPVKDFAPAGLAAYVPQLFVVHPSVAAKTMAELIDLAKARPGTVNFGTPGVGSIGHLSIALLNTTTGAKFVHVPYRGAGPAVIDLVGGRIQVFVGSVTGTQPQISAGRIRALATGHLKRLRSMPDLPTVAETVPGFLNDGWYGIFAPAGTPAPIINKLNAEMKRALANSEFTKHIETLGMEPAGGTPQELGKWVRSELARWTKAVRDAGIQVQGS